MNNLEFLRRHDQHSQRLHFLYNSKSQQQQQQQTLNVSLTATSKTTIKCWLTIKYKYFIIMCMSWWFTNYYTLVQGEQFFKNSFRLSEQPSFGRSLFRPDLHVIHSHPDI